MNEWNVTEYYDNRKLIKDLCSKVTMNHPDRITDLKCELDSIKSNNEESVFNIELSFNITGCDITVDLSNRDNLELIIDSIKDALYRFILNNISVLDYNSIDIKSFEDFIDTNKSLLCDVSSVGNRIYVSL
jgi:hypothetical protein